MKKTETFDVDAHGLRWSGDSLGARREIDQSQVTICCQFLAACKPTKRVGIDSYWLKHIIEQWAPRYGPDGTRVGHGYVSNGACIRAAIDLGLLVVPESHGFSIIRALAGCEDSKFRDQRPINAYIGVSRRNIHRIPVPFRWIGGEELSDISASSKGIGPLGMEASHVYV